MTITKLYCSECNITVKGSFHADRFSNLDEETLGFIEVFILARGNITEIEKQLGISYPTVKSKIEKMVKNIETIISAEKRRAEQDKKELAEKKKKEEKLKERYKMK
jgi:hypothetical protein